MPTLPILLDTEGLLGSHPTVVGPTRAVLAPSGARASVGASGRTTAVVTDDRTTAEVP